VVDRERGVSGSQDTEKVPAESLDGAFGGVCAFVIGGDELVGNLVSVKVGV
jgi:hypothetical protein